MPDQRPSYQTRDQYLDASSKTAGLPPARREFVEIDDEAVANHFQLLAGSYQKPEVRKWDKFQSTFYRDETEEDRINGKSKTGLRRGSIFSEDVEMDTKQSEPSVQSSSFVSIGSSSTTTATTSTNNAQNVTEIHTTTPLKTKNDIFATSFAIAKPATKASADELELLKHGQGIPYVFPSTTATSTIPPPINPETSSLLPVIPPSVKGAIEIFKGSLELPKIASPATATPVSGASSPGAFMDWTPTPSIHNQQTQPKPAVSNAQTLPSPSPSLITPFTLASIIDHLPPEMSRDLHLSYLPIKRNFLGEGRYAEVFRGEYSIIPETENALSLPQTAEEFGTRRSSSRAVLGDLKPCAVKRLHKSDDAHVMGLMEVYILKAVAPQSPHILKLIGVKEEVDTPVAQPKRKAAPAELDRRILVISEFQENGNMWDYILKHRDTVGKRIWMKWARQLAYAVLTLHNNGVVHHDIKPHNVLLDEFLDVRLADFGNALYIPALAPVGTNNAVDFFTKANSMNDSNSSSSLPQMERKASNPALLGMLPRRLSVAAMNNLNIETRARSAFDDPSYQLRDGVGRGTQSYNAPELLVVDGIYSLPVDIYSLGVTFYSMISAKDPFDQARSGVEMLMGIKRGFFESGLQSPLTNTAQSTLAEASSPVRQPGSRSPTPGLMSNDPLVWRFLNGDIVEDKIVQLIKQCLSRDPKKRPTAKELVDFLEELDDFVPIEEKL